MCTTLPDNLVDGLTSKMQTLLHDHQGANRVGLEERAAKRNGVATTGEDVLDGDGGPWA